MQQRNLERKTTPAISTQRDQIITREQLLKLKQSVDAEEKAENITAEAKVALYEDAIHKLERATVEQMDENYKSQILINIAIKLLVHLRARLGSDSHQTLSTFNKLHYAHKVLVVTALRLSNPPEIDIPLYIKTSYDAGMFALDMVASGFAKQANLDLLRQAFFACIHFAKLVYPLDEEILKKVLTSYKGLAAHAHFLRDHFANDAKIMQARINSEIDEAKFGSDRLLRKKIFFLQGNYNDEKAWQDRCEAFSALTFPCGLDVINMKDFVCQRIESLLNSQSSIEELLAFLKLIIPYQSKFQLFDPKYDLDFLKEMAEANEDGRMVLFDSLFAKVESYASQSTKNLDYFTGMIDTLCLSIGFLKSIRAESTKTKLNERYQKIAKAYYLYFKHVNVKNFSAHVEWFYKLAALLIPEINATNLAEDNNLFLRALLCLVKLIGVQANIDGSVRADIMLRLTDMSRVKNYTIDQLLMLFIELLSDSNAFSLADFYKYYNELSGLLSDNEEIREEYLAYIVSMQCEAINASPALALSEAHEKLFHATQACKSKKGESLDHSLFEFVIKCYTSDKVQSAPSVLFDAYFRWGVLTKSHALLLKALEYKIVKPSPPMQLLIAECHARLGFHFKKIGEFDSSKKYIEDACRLYAAIKDVDMKKSKPKMLLKCEAFLADAKAQERQAARDKAHARLTRKQESDVDGAAIRRLNADADISSAQRQFLNAMAELKGLLEAAQRQIKLLAKDKQVEFVTTYTELLKQLSMYEGLKQEDRKIDDLHKSIADCTRLTENLTKAHALQKATATPKESRWKPREEKDKEVKEKKESKNDRERKSVPKTQRDIIAHLAVSAASPVAQTAPAARTERKSDAKNTEDKPDFLRYTLSRLKAILAIYKIANDETTSEKKKIILKYSLMYNLLRVCVYYKHYYQESRKPKEILLRNWLAGLRTMLIHQGAAALSKINIFALIPEFLVSLADKFQGLDGHAEVEEFSAQVKDKVQKGQLTLDKLLQAIQSDDDDLVNLNMRDCLLGTIDDFLPTIHDISAPFIKQMQSNSNMDELKKGFTPHMQALRLLFTMVGEYYDKDAFTKAIEQTKNAEKAATLRNLKELIHDCHFNFRNKVAHTIDDPEAQEILAMSLRFQALNPDILRGMVYEFFKVAEAPEVRSKVTHAKKC